MFENITAGIVTLLIYGIIIMGCIIPLIFIVRTKHSITKFGYRKYLFIIVGLEAVLLLAAALILFLLTNSFYNSNAWNKRGINMEFFIMLYQLMLKYILPVYLLLIALLGVYANWKEKHSTLR
ncbi:MAG: hypothetical protein HFJ06_12450 [Lachnospiraceae bacterium]|nr:hypothetical protein [Lachnospiraceae bacterium]